MRHRQFQKKAKTVPITSPNIPKTSGLYNIKDWYKPSVTLYGGTTNNLKRRVGEHLRGRKQMIDLYLDHTNLRGVRLQYTPMKNPGSKERGYLKSIKKNEGRKSLPLNFKAGNAASARKSSRRRRNR